VKGILLAIVISNLVVILASCDSQAPAPSKDPKQIEFESKRTTIVAEMERLLTAGKGREAIGVGSPFRRFGDPEIEKLLLRAASVMEAGREKELLESIRAAKPGDHHAKISYYAELQKLAPTNQGYQQGWTKERAALDKQIEAQRQKALAVDRAKRKREGVSIGMTREEVLMSSWGKPDRINKTTTASGTREQWVYSGGRGYLYFGENGRLTTIQN
jgi:hypothetical protein